jgi:hypothetical protein
MKGFHLINFRKKFKFFLILNEIVKSFYYFREVLGLSF